jgi:hypothetical protein
VVKRSDMLRVSQLVNSLHRDYCIEIVQPCSPCVAFEIDHHLSEELCD